MEIGTLCVKITADLFSLQRGVEQARAQVENLGARLQSAMQAAEPASKALGVALAGVAVGMGALGVKAIAIAGQVEQSKIAFTTMLGSAQAANEFLRELYAFAARTPFEVAGLEKSSRMLLAFGFEAEKIIPIMTGVGNAVAGLGGGAFEIERVVRALGQMRARGKITGEEMMQLTEVGIPAWEMLAEVIGTDIPTAMKMVSDGAVPAAAAIEGLVAGMNKRFPEMMEKQSTTLLGLWSTLKDNLSTSLVAIGDEIVRTFDLKTKLAGMIEWVKNLATVLQEEGLKGALANLFPPSLELTILAVAGAVAGALVPALFALATGVWAALAPLLPFMAAGAAVAALAYFIMTSWRPIRDFFVGLWTAIKDFVVGTAGAIADFFRSWGPLLLAILTGPIKVITYLVYAKWSEIQTFTVGIWTAIADFFRSWGALLLEALTKLVEAVVHLFRTEWEEVKVLTVEVWATVSGWLFGLWENIRAEALAAWDHISATIIGFQNRIKETFLDLVGGAWGWGRNLISRFIEGFKSRLADLRRTVKRAAETVADFLGFSSPTKEGPGREADQWAPNLVRIYAEGVIASLPKLRASLKEFALNLSPVGIVNIATVMPGATRGSTINYGGITINIYGGTASDQAGQILRELQRRGVRL